MLLFSFRRKIDDLERLREITSVFFNTGFGLLAEKIKLKQLVPWRERVRCKFGRCHCHAREDGALEGRTTLVPPPQALREAFEKLGPTFVKLGQMLSLREDLIGAEYARELKKLQENARPMPYSDVHKIIQQAFGHSPQNLFKTFEKIPLASASLAQVHCATLKTGEAVVVKVQRPRVKEIIASDAHILLYIAHLLATYWPQARMFKPVEVIKEFSQSMMREIDFTAEGANADHFRYNFRENDRVHIPEIFWSFTKPTVLTMEYVQGIKVVELQKSKRRVERTELARLGAEMFFQEVFLDGFFHSDPHPGNIIILPPNRLALYDFGQVGVLTEDLRRTLLAAFVALRNREVFEYIEHLLRLSHPDGEDKDIESFKRASWDTLNRLFYGDTALKNFHITDAFYAIIISGARYGIVFKSELVLLAKAFVTIESLASQIDPAFDFKDVLEDLMENMESRMLSPAVVGKTFKRVSLEYISLLTELPARTEKLLQKIEQGQVSVKIDTSELRELTQEFDRQNDVRVLALLVVALFVGSAIILRLEESGGSFAILLGRLGMGVTAALFLWLIVLIKKK